MIAKEHMDPMISAPDSNELVNTLTHGIGALLALLAVIALVALAAAHGLWLHALSFAVYGAALVASMAASGLLHLTLLGGRYHRALGVFDHVAIYALIAGTFTPFFVVVMTGSARWLLLGLVWAIGLVCAVAKIVAFARIPVWASLLSYLAMGWLAVFVVPSIAALLGPGATALLIGAGLLYTFGAVVFVRGTPNPFPPYFGSHEIWHIAVLSANAMLLAVMAFFVLPYR